MREVADGAEHHILRSEDVEQHSAVFMMGYSDLTLTPAFKIRQELKTADTEIQLLQSSLSITRKCANDKIADSTV